jgi:hypothetical protein
MDEMTRLLELAADMMTGDNFCIMNKSNELLCILKSLRVAVPMRCLMATTAGE